MKYPHLHVDSRLLEFNRCSFVALSVGPRVHSLHGPRVLSSHWALDLSMIAHVHCLPISALHLLLGLDVGRSQLPTVTVLTSIAQHQNPDAAAIRLRHVSTARGEHRRLTGDPEIHVHMPTQADISTLRGAATSPPRPRYLQFSSHKAF